MDHDLPGLSPLSDGTAMLRPRHRAVGSQLRTLPRAHYPTSPNTIARMAGLCASLPGRLTLPNPALPSHPPQIGTLTAQLGNLSIEPAPEVDNRIVSFQHRVTNEEQAYWAEAHYVINPDFFEWMRIHKPLTSIDDELVEAYSAGEITALELEGAMMDLIKNQFPGPLDLESFDGMMQDVLEEGYGYWRLLLSENGPENPDHNGFFSRLPPDPTAVHLTQPIEEGLTLELEPSYVHQLENHQWSAADLVGIQEIQHTFNEADEEDLPWESIQDAFLWQYFLGHIDARLFHIAMMALFRRSPFRVTHAEFEGHLMEILGDEKYFEWMRDLENSDVLSNLSRLEHLDDVDRHTLATLYEEAETTEEEVSHIFSPILKARREQREYQSRHHYDRGRPPYFSPHSTIPVIRVTPASPSSPIMETVATVRLTYEDHLPPYVSERLPPYTSEPQMPSQPSSEHQQATTASAPIAHEQVDVAPPPMRPRRLHYRESSQRSSSQGTVTYPNPTMQPPQYTFAKHPSNPQTTGPIPALFHVTSKDSPKPIPFYGTLFLDQSDGMGGVRNAITASAAGDLQGKVEHGRGPGWQDGDAMSMDQPHDRKSGGH